MGKVKFNGTPFKDQDGKRLESFEDVLAEQAKCDCGGVDCCYGFMTLIDAATGDLMAIWIENGVLKTDTKENAMPILKALKASRS